jgi:hypothetical protein
MQRRGFTLSGFVCLAVLGCASQVHTTAASTTRAVSPKPKVPPDHLRSGRYALVGGILLYVDEGHFTNGKVAYEGTVTLRLNRRLPVKDDAPDAVIEVSGGSGASPPIRFTGKQQHCYTEVIDGFPSPAPHTGGTAVVTVNIAGGAYLRKTTRVLTAAQGRRLRRSFHCGTPIVPDGD